MDQAVVMACAGEPVMRVAVIWYTHIQAIINGVLLPGDTVLARRPKHSSWQSNPVRTRC